LSVKIAKNIAECWGLHPETPIFLSAAIWKFLSPNFQHPIITVIYIIWP